MMNMYQFTVRDFLLESLALLMASARRRVPILELTNTTTGGLQLHNVIQMDIVYPSR